MTSCWIVCAWKAWSKLMFSCPFTRCRDFLACTDRKSGSFAGLHALGNKTGGFWRGTVWNVRAHHQHWLWSICRKVRPSSSLVKLRSTEYRTKVIQNRFASSLLYCNWFRKLKSLGQPIRWEATSDWVICFPALFAVVLPCSDWFTFFLRLFVMIGHCNSFGFGLLTLN